MTTLNPDPFDRMPGEHAHVEDVPSVTRDPLLSGNDVERVR